MSAKMNDEKIVGKVNELLVCGYCAKEMTEEKTTGDRCCRCDKWVCGECDLGHGIYYLKEDVRQKSPMCDQCILSSYDNK